MKIAILGFGTVGSGVYETIQRYNTGLQVKRILDIAVREGYEDIMTTDIDDILGDPEIEAVVEVMGGVNPAHRFVSAALNAGKSVVSANKQLISSYFTELTLLADANGKKLRYTAAAGGGIPWLYNLRRARRCDDIQEISGIINGTTNYILDSMHRDRDASFEAALASAQRLGYAEADPSADIDGHDIQRKLAISANIAFNTIIGEAQVSTYGIRDITREDVDYFLENGYVCKLLACAAKVDGGLCAYVEPMLIRPGMPEAAVPANYNMVTLVGETVGRLSFFGQGAGKDPTGNAVVQDLLDIMIGEGELQVPTDSVPVLNGKAAHRYYVRTREGSTITEPVSVQHMHERAEAEGISFFAGIADELIG